MQSNGTTFKHKISQIFIDVSAIVKSSSLYITLFSYLSFSSVNRSETNVFLPAVLLKHENGCHSFVVGCHTTLYVRRHATAVIHLSRPPARPPLHPRLLVPTVLILPLFLSSLQLKTPDVVTVSSSRPFLHSPPAARPHPLTVPPQAPCGLGRPRHFQALVPASQWRCAGMRPPSIGTPALLGRTRQE